MYYSVGMKKREGYSLWLLGPIPYVLKPRIERGPPRKNLNRNIETLRSGDSVRTVPNFGYNFSALFKHHYASINNLLSRSL